MCGNSRICRLSNLFVDILMDGLETVGNTEGYDSSGIAVKMSLIK
jgi:glucosamine 6-phosphate synthetase-like amidotransferase/phosphosugar isomerase protein